MTTKFSICITSGIQGPESQLTEEQSQRVSELAGQLTEPWIGGRPLGVGLSPDHFLVIWENDSAPILGVRTTIRGYVSMWKQGDTDWHDFVDTVGLWSYLAPIGSTTYQNWMKEFQKETDVFCGFSYNEKEGCFEEVFRISQ